MRKLFVVSLIILAMCFSGAAIAQDQNVAGKWNITINFVRGTGNHTAVITQDGNELAGAYKGAALEGKLRGRVEGKKVTFSTSLRNQTASSRFSFTGTIEGDSMKGTVNMGEYWSAEWTAKRAKK
ncbi:MAG: hypothetical protein HOC71_02770 [Candidatus Latescibacteria bacterium]|jgi:hypothetical protein|nr:hypothetical protein [Candidatus Latescibacterota bacterium]